MAPMVPAPSRFWMMLPLFLFVLTVSVALPAALMILAIRALLKYIRSRPEREEKTAVKRSLGETIRDHRTRCGMTQEFVAESLGISRQAVSKWEKGQSEPSTSNLLALSKLFGISAAELLRDAE